MEKREANGFARRETFEVDPVLVPGRGGRGGLAGGGGRGGSGKDEMYEGHENVGSCAEGLESCGRDGKDWRISVRLAGSLSPIKFFEAFGSTERIDNSFSLDN